MALELIVFDFDDPESWKKVQAAVNEPLPARALAAGMKAHCQASDKKWTPELGPWQLDSRKTPDRPKPGSPDWYRIYSYPHVIAPWCAAIGSLVFPDHQWLVWYNRHLPKSCSHSAGMGLRDDEKRSIVIMDILRGPQALHEGTERKLLKLLSAKEAYSLSIEEAIEQLESGQYQ